MISLVVVGAAVVGVVVLRSHDEDSIELPELTNQADTEVWIRGEGAIVVALSNEVAALIDEPPASAAECESWMSIHLEPLGTPTEMSDAISAAPDVATGQMALDTFDVTLRYFAACVQGTAGPTLDELAASQRVLAQRLVEVTA